VIGLWHFNILFKTILNIRTRLCIRAILLLHETGIHIYLYVQRVKIISRLSFLFVFRQLIKIKWGTLLLHEISIYICMYIRVKDHLSKIIFFLKKGNFWYFIFLYNRLFIKQIKKNNVKNKLNMYVYVCWYIIINY